MRACEEEGVSGGGGGNPYRAGAHLYIAARLGHVL